MWSHPWPDPVHNLYLDAGATFMNGDLALTYVRSRFGAGNNDFVRAGRQQELAVIQPPECVTPATGAGGAYILIPNFEAIQELAQRLMGDTQ